MPRRLRGWIRAADMGRDKTQVGVKRIEGRDVEVLVDNKGQFSAEVGGETYEGKTMDALVDKVRRVLKRNNPVRVPVTLVEAKSRWNRSRGEDEPEALEFTDAAIVSLHGRTGRAIIDKEDGQPPTTQDYGTTTLRRLTEDEKGKLRTAHRAQQRAERLYSKYVEEWQINGRDEFEKAAARADGRTVEEEERDAV